MLGSGFSKENINAKLNTNINKWLTMDFNARFSYQTIDGISGGADANESSAGIAAIPIGYADGLNRHLGRGNAYCLVNGKKAPYVGNICMDVCMIDVTDIDCREGDQAIIFGDDLPITVLSDKLETIPYEVLTSISTRVKRVYYQD